MKISELKTIINEMIAPASAKRILNVSGQKLTSSKEALRTVPVPEYIGKAELQGGEMITWSFFFNGDDWEFSSYLDQ